jgi:succinyl-diaminopimelate desuccinylase
MSGTTELDQLLLWLCSVPSLIGEERALADALEERFRTVSLASRVRRYGDSLVVPLSRVPSAPKVLLAGHLDVVRTEHDGPARIEGDRLYGAGAADMKSGLCLMLDVIARGAPADLDVTLVFYAREEGPFAENELGRVLEEDDEVRSADVALALEPSDNKLQLGCGGSLHASVAFAGRTAHSARPWQGENAIHKAAALLGRLGARKPEPDIEEGFEWQRVMSATLASGGRARNIIPDRFELNVNYRFGPNTSIERAKADVLELVAGEAETTFVDESPSAPPRLAHPLIRLLSESGVRAVEPKQAWTDVARFSAAGIAAANFGPGVQAQAHQRNEWTLISQLASGREILGRFLSNAGRIALTALCVCVALPSLVACDDAAGTSRRRSDAVADASLGTPPLFERDELLRFQKALVERVGKNPRLLELDLREHEARVQLESRERAGEIVELTYTRGALGAPRQAEVRGSGPLESNLFELEAIALDRVPELATNAATQIDAENGRIVRVLVRRHLPSSQDVRFRVYVDSPRLSGHVDADARGELIQPAESQPQKPEKNPL